MFMCRTRCATGVRNQQYASNAQDNVTSMTRFDELSMRVRSLFTSHNFFKRFCKAGMLALLATIQPAVAALDVAPPEGVPTTLQERAWSLPIRCAPETMKTAKHQSTDQGTRPCLAKNVVQR